MLSDECWRGTIDLLRDIIHTKSRKIDELEAEIDRLKYGLEVGSQQLRTLVEEAEAAGFKGSSTLWTALAGPEV